MNIETSNLIQEIRAKCKKCVVSLSGGLDSTILTYLLVKALGKDSVIAISYDYNQRHDIELQRARVSANKLGIKHIIINLKDLLNSSIAMSKDSYRKIETAEDTFGHPQPESIYIPYRNMIMGSILFSKAEQYSCDKITLGIQALDEFAFWDCTSAFMNRMNDISQLNRMKNIEMISPLVSLSKSQVIALGIDLEVSFQDTHTCYDPQDELACGVCPACKLRLKGFYDNKIKDPVRYI